MSSVRIAILKPSPGAPSSRSSGNAAAVEADARQRMRRDHVDALGDLEAGIVGENDESRRCPARPALRRCGRRRSRHRRCRRSRSTSSRRRARSCRRRAGRRSVMAATSEPASGSESAKAAIMLAARTAGSTALLHARRAGKRDRAGAEPLHGEGEIGEAVVHRRASRAAMQSGARIDSSPRPAVGRRHAVRRAARRRRASRTRRRQAASDVRMIDAVEPAGRAIQRSSSLGEGAMRRAEERPIEMARVWAARREGVCTSIPLEDGLATSRRTRRRRGGSPRSPCRSPAPAPRTRSSRRCPWPIPGSAWSSSRRARTSGPSARRASHGLRLRQHLAGRMQAR